jgi:Zn-dependent protease
MVFVLFFGIGLHEYAHCKFADLAGDPTPSFYGRLTLNLTKHFEPTGTIMMIISSTTGYGLGWGRAAPMNPDKMHNPRWDFFVAVIAGPTSNVVQAAIYALVFRLMAHLSPGAMGTLQDPSLFTLLCFYGVQINLALALFNMIPLGPLDGHWLLGLLMPEKQRILWFQWNRNVGRTGLMVILIVSQLISRSNPDYDFFSRYFYPIVDSGTRFFLGHH